MAGTSADSVFELDVWSSRRQVVVLGVVVIVPRRTDDDLLHGLRTGNTGLHANPGPGRQDQQEDRSATTERCP